MRVASREPALLDVLVRSLVECAVCDRGIPTEIALAAGEATLRNLRLAHDESVASLRMRTRAYFDATVRRMVARSDNPAAASFRIRLIADVIAEDLRSGGVNESRIAREVGEWMACASA